MIDVETSSEEGITAHGLAIAAVDGQVCCWAREGWPGTAQACFLPVDIGLIVPWIALTVGMDRRARSDAEPASIRTTVGALEGTLTPGSQQFRHVGVEEAGVLRDLRTSWRVTVHGRDGRTARSLVVLDAGPSGMWERLEPSEPLGLEVPDPSVPVVLARRTPGEVWTALTGLLDGLDGVVQTSVGETSD